MPFYFRLILILPVLLISACGGGGGGGDGGSLEVRNVTLSVSAPADFTVDEGETVSLTADGRVSGGNANLQYSWTYIGINPEINLNNPDSRTTTFVAPQLDSDTTFFFQIQLNAEGFIPSDFLTGLPRDIVAVTVRDTTPRPPTANAGIDLTVSSNANVNLNGFGSTDNRGITTYLWRQTAGQTVSLSNADTAVASFTAPIVSVSSVLQFELSVSDAGALTSVDTISVTVEPPEPPVAVVTNNTQTVLEGDQVTLDGSSSSDELGIASYQWIQTGGPSVTIENADSATASFIAPATDNDITLEFSFTVTDLTDLTATENAVVTVRPINDLPQALITYPLSANEETLVTLDGSASNDPDGQIVSYQWTQLRGPTISLSDSDTAIVSFTSPISTYETIFTFQFVVTDDRGESDSQDISITILPVNLPPTLSVSSVVSALSREGVIIDITAEDSDGSIHSVNVIQTTGPKVSLGGGIYSRRFTAPLVDTDEVFSFDITIVDNEGASVTESLSITVQRPANLTEVYFPIDGSLYEGDQISVQGRATENGVGVQANLSVQTTAGSFSTTSDINGYWRVDDVELSPNTDSHSIFVETSHGSGESSSAQITVEAKQVPISGAKAIVENCGNDQFFVLLPQAVVEMDCDGTDRKIIASSNVGTGVPMPNARFMAYTFVGPQAGDNLIVDSADGLVSISLFSKERSVIYPRNGDPAINVQLLTAGDGFNERVFVKDGNASSDLNSLLAIDVETGISEVLTAVNQTLIDEGIVNSVAAIESRRSGSEIYVSTYAGRVLLIDVVTGSFEEIANGSAFGNHISDITHYSSLETYLFDANSSAIYSLSSGSFYPPREIVFPDIELLSGGYKDADVDYAGAYALARNRSNSIVRLLTNYDSDVFSSNIITEDVGENSHDLGLLTASTYDPNTGRLFVSGNDAIHSIDLDTGKSQPFFRHENLEFLFDWETLTYDSMNNYLFVSDVISTNPNVSKIAYLDGLTADILQPPLELAIDNPFIAEIKLDNRISGGIYLKGSINANSYGETLYHIIAPFALNSEGKVLATPLSAIDQNHLPLGAIAGTVASNVLYGIKRTEQNLIAIDPDTGASILSLNFDGVLADSIFPDTLDWSEENSLLYLSSSGAPRSIYSWDPTTQEFTQISSSMRGRGPALQTAQNIHVDSQRRIIIVQELDGVFVVDRDSGDRVLIYTN